MTRNRPKSLSRYRNYPKNPKRKVKAKGRAKKGADPLAHLPLLAYMNLHFEHLLVTGYSAETVRHARQRLRQFIAWCDERGLTKPADISKQILERYQRHLFYYRKSDGSPLTIGTQAAALVPLKLWFKWLARENHILFNPASEIDIPRGGKRIPRVILSIADVEKILAEAVPDNPMGLRDRAMLELLYSTGMRRMEAAGLAVYDIDFNRRLVMIREGKGRRDRVIPVGARALQWLDKYLLEGRPKLMVSDHTALFVTDYGEAALPKFIADRVKKYMDYAGINKTGAAHLLRHACATHMLEGGADIRFIQSMLGHENLETTEIYTHVSIEKLQSVHDATHPARLHRQPTEEPASPTLEDREALLTALETDDTA